MVSNSDDQKETEKWIRQFPRAANQRFTTAQFLMEHGYNLDAMYLAGYAVECAFKAAILVKTPRSKRADILREITSGQESHNIEHLRHLLNEAGYQLPLKVARHVREIAKKKWSNEKGSWTPTQEKTMWSPAWRYEVGRRDTEEANEFLEHVKEILHWMKGVL